MPKRTPVNPEHADHVRSLAETGLSDTDIAARLDIPVRKLRRGYQRELLQGIAEGNYKVLQKLHQAACSGTNINAASLWAKARCGWRDTGASSASGIQVLPTKLVVTTPQIDAKDLPTEQ